MCLIKRESADGAISSAGEATTIASASKGAKMVHHLLPEWHIHRLENFRFDSCYDNRRWSHYNRTCAIEIKSKQNFECQELRTKIALGTVACIKVQTV